MEALTAIAPGEDCAIAVRALLASSSIQPSSSTNFFCINGMITNPPPKVQALSSKVEKNNFLYFCKLFTSKNAVLSMFINIIPLDF